MKLCEGEYRIPESVVDGVGAETLRALNRSPIRDQSIADSRQLAADIVDEVLASHDLQRISTHYDGCWKYHVACLAILLKETLE